jgi:hypothetical protein
MEILFPMRKRFFGGIKTHSERFDGMLVSGLPSVPSFDTMPYNCSDLPVVDRISASCALKHKPMHFSVAHIGVNQVREFFCEGTKSADHGAAILRGRALLPYRLWNSP